MGWGKGKKDDDPKKKDEPLSPEAVEKRGRKPGARDALCTECGTWYDSSNDAQVNRHAH